MDKGASSRCSLAIFAAFAFGRISARTKSPMVAPIRKVLMSRNEESSDKNPSSLVPLLRGMNAEIQLLRDAIIFLCSTTVPRDSLDIYIERLGVPIDWGSSENLEIMERTISAFLSDLEKSRPITKD